MTNFSDLIGGFLQNAMSTSGGQRIDRSINDLQRSQFNLPGVGSGGGADIFSGLNDLLRGGLSGAAANPAQAGGIGAIVGSLLGGGSKSMKGALGGGALALLASIAMKSMMNSRAADPQGLAGQPNWSGGDAPLGMKMPETPEQEQMLHATAELVLRGMINAAKADGEISNEEASRILGKLRESGLDDDSQQWLIGEIQKPLDLPAFVAEIPNEEVAAEVYAASLLAIEVDTDAERQYLQQLAQQSGLHPSVVQQIHRTMDAVS